MWNKAASHTCIYYEVGLILGTLEVDIVLGLVRRDHRPPPARPFPGYADGVRHRRTSFPNRARYKHKLPIYFVGVNIYFYKRTSVVTEESPSSLRTRRLYFCLDIPKDVPAYLKLLSCQVRWLDRQVALEKKTSRSNHTLRDTLLR